MATISKQDRKLFGKSGRPVPATRTLVRDMPFDHEGIQTRSWIVINEKTGTRVHANTYDGNLGAKATHKELPYAADGKGMAKKLRDYTEVNVTDCPFAVQA